jgi:hypothetical protein
MTISPEDLVHLPWDESLTLAGVTYLERTLVRALASAACPSPSDLRGQVASVAADLALRRWLDEANVPYGLIGDEPFTRPEWPRLAVGGRRLVLHTSLVSSRRAIRRLRRSASIALEAPAAIVRSRLEAAELSEGDLVGFALSLALETRTLTDLERATAARQPIHLLAAAPRPLGHVPSAAADLGVVSLSSPAGPCDVILQGLLPDHGEWSAPARLGPSPAYQSPPLHALMALHALHRPPGPILICTASRPDPWRLHPGEWTNLWLYGIEILLLGWSSIREFRARATSASPSIPFPELTRPPRGSLHLLMRDLRPFASLVEHIHHS